MRILTIHRGFSADHSSSTYEFFALDRLTPEERETVHNLTGERPRRHLSFHYWGDWSDIPSDWPDHLLTSGYDILVSESYDWWSVSLSLPRNPDLAGLLAPYECEYDGHGFGMRELEEHLLLYFGMHLDYGAAFSVFGEALFEGLADLFEEIREELLAGDPSAAWIMYDPYCGYTDEDVEPVAPLSRSAEILLGIIVEQ